MKGSTSADFGCGSFALTVSEDESANRVAIQAFLSAAIGEPGEFTDSLIDCPAKSLSLLTTWEERYQLSTHLANGKTRPIVIVPITPAQSSRASVFDALELGPNYRVVVVKSEWFGKSDDYRRWNGSQLRQRLLSAGGLELTMPRLAPYIAADLDDESLTFSEGLKKLDVLDASSLSHWLRTAETALKPLFDLMEKS